MLRKLIYCLLLLFAMNNAFAQQRKDSVPDYMKKFKMYKLPGMGDSAFNLKHWDSVKLWKKTYDSILQQRIINTPSNHITYNNWVTGMANRK